MNNSYHTPSSDSAGWYVVWTESRAEKKVAERLMSRGFDVWLPVVPQRRRWSDRWMIVTMPLFPGYLFARARNAGWQPLLTTPGVLTLVKQDLKPVLLAHDYVERIRRAVEDSDTSAEAPETPHRFLSGDEVVVRDGPLAGLRGVVVESRGARKLLIWVAGVGRGLACALGTALVEPAMPVR